LTNENNTVIISLNIIYFGNSEINWCGMALSGKYNLPDVLSEKISDARKSLGLTLQQVSSSISFSVSTLSEIENGKRRVSAVELYQFAKLFEKPITFFLEQEKFTDSFSILFRASISNTPPLSKQTVSRFHEYCRNYKELITKLGTPLAPSITDYSMSELTTYDDAEKLAETERGQLGLNGQPLKEISELLESKKGVKIFYLPENPEVFSGAFVYDQELGPCFLINSLHPRLRRVFTIAHEYAHCLAHRDKLAHIDSVDLLNLTNPKERFANAFAAAFLMPQHGINEILSNLISKYDKSISFEVVISLAIYFGVSFEATGWRLVSLRKLNRGEWEEIRDEWEEKSPIAKLLGYKNEIDIPEPLPHHYRYLANKAYTEKLISFERLAELLGRNYFELREELYKAKREGND
jgi:Zn-dependent peptidase ImmA (M78 family)/DNA-binding XRE family transcriptional regulator